MAILTPDKVDFRAQKFTRDEVGHYIKIKRPIHQEDIATLNVYVPNATVPII